MTFSREKIKGSLIPIEESDVSFMEDDEGLDIFEVVKCRKGLNLFPEGIKRITRGRMILIEETGAKSAGREIRIAIYDSNGRLMRKNFDSPLYDEIKARYGA